MKATDTSKNSEVAEGWGGMRKEKCDLVFKCYFKFADLFSRQPSQVQKLLSQPPTTTTTTKKKDLKNPDRA